MHKLYFKTHHLILGFNLFLMSFLLLEILYPSENRVEEQLSTFYSQTKTFHLKGSSNKETKFYMKCKRGQVYPLAMLPENHDSFKKGDIVWIEKSVLLKKPNRIISNNKTYDLSILNNHIILGLFIFNVVLLFSQVFFYFEKLKFLLAFVTLFNIIFWIMYLY